MTAMLEVKDLRVAYGKIEAVKGISFAVEAGQVVTLIGTNGAGKTTTLRTLSGLLQPVAGEIWFEGKRIDGTPAHDIVAAGACPLPRGPAHLPAADDRGEPAARRLPPQGQGGDQRRPPAGLRPVPDAGGAPHAAGRARCSGGEQQMLAMGRALMCRPRLLMLDEPSMGLSPIMMQKIMIDGRRAAVRGHHDPARRAERPGRAVAGRHGLCAGDRPHRAAGTGEELLTNDEVRKAYLGED